MKTLLSGLIGLFCAMPGFSSSLCDSIAGNIVANCGFEGGTYSSNIDGTTNSNVPNSWTPNAGFDDYTSFDHVVAGPVNSGSYALSIGNDDPQPVPMLSQTLTDTPGVTYDGSLYVYYGGAGTSDTSVFFDAIIDNTDVVTLNNSAPAVYTPYTFSFVGTGSDTLTLQGNTTPSEWYVDDIVITGTATSAIPEPNTALLIAVSCGVLLLLRRRVTNCCPSGN